MLFRDPFSGALHEAPDLSEYDVGEVVYDRFGNPVALAPPGLAFDDGLGSPVGLPFLAPLLPIIAGAAKAVIPAITGLLPGGNGPGPSAPPPPPASSPAPGPAAAVAPGPHGPVVVRRLYRRRGVHAR